MPRTATINGTLVTACFLLRHLSFPVLRPHSPLTAKILANTANYILHRGPRPSRTLPYIAHEKAVALLEQMGERCIQPDEVCYGATIAALSEVAGKQTRSTWGAGTKEATPVQAGPKETSWGSKREGGAVTHADRAPGEHDGDIVPTRAHEKAVALIERMRRDGPRYFS